MICVPLGVTLGTIPDLPRMLRQIIRTDNVDLTVEAGGVRHCFSTQNVPQEYQGAVALLPQILGDREVNAAP